MPPKYRSVLFIVSLFLSCSNHAPTLEELVNQITIKTESNYLIANGISTISFSTETNLKPLETSQLNIQYFANGVPINKDFRTSDAGNYKVWAEVNRIKSNDLILTARPELDYNPLEFKVIFHLINIDVPNNDLEKAMQLLNDTYGLTSPSLDPNSVDTRIQFKLAELDPYGNQLKQKGSVSYQVDRSKTVVFEDWMWDVYWDPDYYINVWVGNTGSEYSFGSFPVIKCGYPEEGVQCDDSENVTYLHGIAIKPGHLVNDNLISHEMGHFFGLNHIFCYDCCEDYDYCSDTPVYDRLNYETHPTGSFRKSCDNLIFRSWNIMDYQEQDIRYSITYDQRSRIRTILEHSKWSGLDGTLNKSGRIQGIKKNIKKPLNWKEKQTTILN